MTVPQTSQTAQCVRTPASPLVTHSPYFSVWCASDRLTDRWSRHWTGEHQPICGLVRIDGVAYRFAGPSPREVPAMEQVAHEVHATRTTYGFLAGGVRLDVEFLSPLLMDDLEVLARPVTYVTLSVHAVDGQAHEVVAYLDVTAEWCVHGTGEKVWASRHRVKGLETLSLRSVDQPVLKRPGDHTRIDWGTFLLSVPAQATTETAIGSQVDIRNRFAEEGTLPDSDDLGFPRAANDRWPLMAASFSFGLVGADPSHRMAMLAYDEEFAVEYLHRKLPPYWRRNGLRLDGLLHQAHRDYDAIRERCIRFDAELTEACRERGGDDFARLATLAYRQCLAAHCLVEDVDGTLMMFSKENDSNGCIGTVDVTYPGSPLFLYRNPDLLWAQIEPVMKYAQTPRWRFPFAPHDLGQYPLANGQVYGGGEVDEHDQMPVEECGNLLLLVGALCLRAGSAERARPYLPLLRTWAEYLQTCGMDPDKQLCTDDFAGHMAHNANLSIKAILALAAYAEVTRALGNHEEADTMRADALAMAAKWMEMADDGDHTRLAFDRPGTWSQKYNLVWDRLLGLEIFPADLGKRETAYYLSKLNTYGLPLDSRKDYTKLDWCVWTATLANDPDAFQAMVRPLVRFTEETSSRVPMSDWYDTVTGKYMQFIARSVVGGVFLPMLEPVG